MQMALGFSSPFGIRCSVGPPHAEQKLILGPATLRSELFCGAAGEDGSTELQKGVTKCPRNLLFLANRERYPARARRRNLCTSDALRKRDECMWRGKQQILGKMQEPIVDVLR